MPLQTAVYCGVPAANSAFAVAERVFRELAEADGNDATDVRRPGEPRTTYYTL